jgi:hypothetical protein
MISRSTGETTFEGLRILPQAPVEPGVAQQIRPLPVAGWFRHMLGIRNSDHGAFEVEAVSDPKHRIQVLLLSHAHPFYLANTPEDAERRAFHEGVISSDLTGQREFSWGQVFCRLDSKFNKDWLVLAYTLGPQVPAHAAAVLRHLYTHEPEPSND